MPFFFFDPTMMILIPAIIFAFYAQMKIKTTFSKYVNVNSASGKTGAEVAREILDRQGLNNIRVERIGGNLSDHYDPRSRVLKLSPQVYGSASLASLGVAAHEAGHAIQDAQDYVPLRLRHSLVPVANFGSQAGPLLAMVGFIFRSGMLLNVGIIFFLAAVLFQIVTLPVEFNASSRALTLLKKYNFLNNQESQGARKVLSAAALTYVSATLVSIGHLVRLLLLRGMVNDE